MSIQSVTIYKLARMSWNFDDYTVFQSKTTFLYYYAHTCTRQKHDFSANVHCNVLKEKSEEKTLVWPSQPGGQVLILT